MNAQRLLWLDNDPAYIAPQVKMLEERQITVDIARTVSDAERLVMERRYDLVIIDVMLPVTEEEERGGYPADSTDGTYKTGLVFFRRNADALRASGARVMVLTLRIDVSIRQDFIEAGLHPDSFRTKWELRDSPTFVEFIVRHLAAPAGWSADVKE